MKHFLKRRLQVNTWQDDDEPDDALPLDMGGLPEWGVGDRVLTQRLAGLDIATCREIATRRGDLPPGRIGEQLLNRVGNTVEALLRVCEAERAQPPRSVDIALDLDGVALTGTVARGPRPHAARGHLLQPRRRSSGCGRGCATSRWSAQLDDRDLASVCIGRRRGEAGRSICRQLDPAEARGVLTDLLALRRAGLRSPLPLALKTSERYAERLHAGKTEAAARHAAGSRWQSFDARAARTPRSPTS